MSNSTVDSDQRTSPWTQRWFIASAVVVALLVVMAVVLILTRPSEQERAAPPPAAASTPSASTTPSADPDTSACGLPAGEQTVPRSTPLGAEWELVGSIAAPTAPQAHGPGLVDDGLRTCFARSPLGALYAAVNFLATTSVPDRRESLIRELTATSDGREAALAALAAEGEQSSGGDAGTQVVGFSFLNYDENSTTVDLALRGFSSGGSAGLAHLPLTLRWEGGDWKVVLPEDGDIGRALQGLPDLTGYVPWSGV